METKSRYEALGDLEAQKRTLLSDKFALGDELKAKEKEIREIERELEDKKEELNDFKERLEDKKAHFDGLIAAVDKGIEVFSKQLNSQKK